MSSSEEEEEEEEEESVPDLKALTASGGDLPQEFWQVDRWLFLVDFAFQITPASF